MSRRHTAAAARRRPAPIQPAAEPLEHRLLFATDYLLNGNQLTVTTNGTAAAPVTVDPTNYAITGDAGYNRVTVQNFAGRVTVNGTGGGDLITVYGGGGGTVVVHDAAPTASNPDTLVVRAPTTVRADVAVTPGTVTVGTDTVNYDATVGSVSLLGQLFTGGDNLTVNATAAADQATINGASVALGSTPTLYYSTFNTLTLNGNGGDDTFTVNNTSVPTTLVAGAGNALFTVNSNSAPLAIVGATAGSDAVIVNANSGPLTVTGSAAPVTVTINASSASTTVNGGTTTNVVAVNGNSALLTVNGGGTANTVNVNGNSGTVNVNGAAGADAYTVSATTGTVTLRGGSGATTYNIPTPTLAPVNVTGGSGTGVLTFGGTPGADNFNVTANTLTAGTGATVTHSNLTGVIVTGGTGTDTFRVDGAAVPTTLVGGSGADTYNVLNNTARTTVRAGTGPSTVNVGSNAPSRTADTLAPVAGGVTVVGNGADTLNLLDAADTAPRAVTLTATTLAGLTAAPVAYANVAALNLALGSASDTITVNGTAAATVTTVSTGLGTNAVTVTPDAVAGPLNLAGSGTDALTVDDSATATAGKTATVTPATISGLGAGPITYAGMASLAVRLGTGGTSLTVANTNAATPTAVYAGAGPGYDTVTIAADASPTAVTTGAAAARVNVQSTAAPTVVNAGGQTLVHAGQGAERTNALAAPLTVNGSGTDSLLVSDANDPLPSTVTISDAQVAGLSPAPVAYSGLATLTVNVGGGGSSATINATAAAATTTNLNGGTGPDTVLVHATSGPTNVAVALGTDAVTVGPALAAVAGPLAVVGNGNTALVLDDSANATPAAGTLTAAVLTGLTTAPVTYSALASVDLRLGTGADALAVGSTTAATRIRAAAGDAITVGTTAGGTLAGLTGPLAVTGPAALVLDDSGDALARTATVAATATVGLSPAPVTYAGLASLAVNTGLGDTAINVRSTAAPTTLVAGLGTDAFTVGDNGSADAIAGPLSIDGHATATLAVDDAATATAKSAAVTAAAVTGLSPAVINYANVAALTVHAGTGNDAVLVRSTAVPTTVDAGGGTNAVRVTNPDFVVGPLSLVGHGGDALTVDDSAARLARPTVTLTPTTLAGVAPVPIAYAGMATVDLALGRAADAVTVANTSAATTTVRPGPAGGTVAVLATTGPLLVRAAATGTVATAATASALAGPLSIVGNGNDTLTLADTTHPAAVTLAADTVAGAGPAPVAYANVAQLTLTLGNDGNTVDVRDTAAANTTLNTGTGTSAVHVAAVAAPLTLVGSGHDALTADAPAAATLTPTTLTLGPGTVTYAGLASITANAAAAFTIADTATPTTVYAAAAAATVTVQQTHAPVTLVGTAGTSATYTLGTNNSLAGLASPVTVRGSGTDTLSADNTADAAPATVTAGSFTTPVSAPVAYAGLSTLSVAGPTTLTIDDAANPAGRGLTVTGATVTGLSPAAVAYRAVGRLALSLGTGDDAVTVDPTALTAPVSIDAAAGSAAASGGGNSLTVNAAADATARAVTITADAVTGFAAPVAYANFSQVAIRLGTADDRAAVADPAAPLILDGGPGVNALNVTANTFAGSVTATRFAATTAAIAADLTGSLVTDGPLAALNVGRNVTGTVAAASVGTAVLPDAHPAADGTVLALTTAGVTRTLRVANNTPGDLSFGLVYDGAPAVPSLAVVVANAHSSASNPFDLILDAPSSAAFNLARVDTSTGTAGVANLVVSGDVLGALTAAQAGALGRPVGAAGGVQLSSDAVAAVSARGTIAPGSVSVASLQMIAFATLTDAKGRGYSAAKPIPNAALLAVFPTDPKTNRPLGRIVRAAGPLAAVVGYAHPVAAYVGTSAGRFDTATVTLSDQVNDNRSVLVTGTLAYDARVRKMAITALTFAGDGGAIDTQQYLSNVTSTGPLGDVWVRAGKLERLDSQTAPSQFGTTRLFGGIRGFGTAHHRRHA